MARIVTCQCGKQYAVRDEDAGRTWRCEVCGRVLAATPPGAPTAPATTSHAAAWAVGIAAAVVVVVGVTLAILLAGRSRREGFVDVPERTRRTQAETRAETQIKILEEQLERYRMDMGVYPSVEKGLQALVTAPDDEDEAKRWQGPYIKRVPKDPWEHDYIYKQPGDHNTTTFDISTPGPDGQEGTEDDIGNWAEEK